MPFLNVLTKIGDDHTYSCFLQKRLRAVEADGFLFSHSSSNAKISPQTTSYK